jgi:arylsulfatase A-like enzyme
VPLVIALAAGEKGTEPAGVGPEPRGLKAGQRYARPVSTVDIAPTILELGGALEPGGAVEGASLAAIARGDLSAKRGPVLARGARRAAVIDWPLKLVVIERKKRSRYLLFDLEADPGETRDQSDVRREDLDRMISTWERFEPKAERD